MKTWDKIMAELKKIFTPLTLTIYGTGSILGAGIYSIIGKVAGLASNGLWLAFLVAMGVSVLISLTYGELISRFPKSGAEAHFVYQAFKSPLFSSLMGWMVLWASTVSMTTLSHAFHGYLNQLVPGLPSWLTQLVFIGGLGLINFLGIEESSRANVVATSIELSGLLLVLASGIAFFWGGSQEAISPMPEAWTIKGLLSGAALAFFAFIGFEDIANVADEVKNPSKTIPVALVGATLLAGILYVSVSIVASLLLAPSELAKASSPLLEVIDKSPLNIPEAAFTLIALFAVSNTALLNSITASRLLYGLSSQGLLPKGLAGVHARRRTPHLAISVVIPLALILAWAGNLVSLAGTTSGILLVVFLCLHISLIKIKIYGLEDRRSFSIPLFVPILGAFATVMLFIFIPHASKWGAMAVIVVGLLLLVLTRKWKPAL